MSEGNPMRMSAAILHHYRVERELADRLRNATKEERRSLYATAYDELFRRVADHPQLSMKRDSTTQASHTERQFKIIEQLVHSDTRYLEIGAGDCALALAVAARVAQVYAVDVSAEIAPRAGTPANFKLAISDGVTIPVPADSIDLAFSNQLMEHLHPDDAQEQLAQIFRALRPGGAYVCITPNRLCGPHDISAYFDAEPTGFHLREYSNMDLISLFREAGFRQFKALLSYKQLVCPAPMPLWPFLLLERVVGWLPRYLGRWLAKPLIAVKLVAIK